MKKIFFIIISFISINAFSQDETQVQQVDSLSSFIKYNESVLTNIDSIYSKFHRAFYKGENDTFPQLIMGIRSQIDFTMNEYLNTHFDMSFSPIKESFLTIIRNIADYNNQNLSKTEEYYQRYHFAIKDNNKKEKETADEQICDFFNKLEKSNEVFIVNYKLEIENLKNYINSSIKK